MEEYQTGKRNGKRPWLMITKDIISGIWITYEGNMNLKVGKIKKKQFEYYAILEGEEFRIDNQDTVPQDREIGLFKVVNSTVIYMHTAEPIRVSELFLD